MLLNQVEEAGMLLDRYPAALRNVAAIRVAPDLQALPGSAEDTNNILVGATIIEKEMEFFVQLSEGRNIGGTEGLLHPRVNCSGISQIFVAKLWCSKGRGVAF